MMVKTQKKPSRHSRRRTPGVRDIVLSQQYAFQKLLV